MITKVIIAVILTVSIGLVMRTLKDIIELGFAIKDNLNYGRV